MARALQLVGTRKQLAGGYPMKTSHALVGAGVILAATMAAPSVRAADDTIKVGVLHSLSGTMAISETTLKDTVLMMVDDINKNGGLLGKKVEAVVVDPASNWPLFAEKARELIQKDKVAVVFGCWTSVSRKSVLPVFEELNGLLFYPVQYEGEESSNNVFYTGAAPNQQAIPAVEYLMSKDGGEAKRWVLEGTDYVYPRTTNKILRAFLKSKGVAAEDIMINYTPFGFSDWQTEVAAIKKFASAGKKTAVVSTINGDANVPFYKELANQGIKATDIPVVAFSVGEEELSGIDTKNLVGHLAAWNYFESVKNPTNTGFIKEWHTFIKNDKRTTNDPMEATYIGFKMWTQAVLQAGTTNVDAVRQAMYGQKVKNLTGGVAVMNSNHHLSKPVLIGEIQANGQFDTVWQTKGVIKADAWSPYLAEDKGKIADWTFPWACESCTAPTFQSRLIEVSGPGSCGGASPASHVSLATLLAGGRRADRDACWRPPARPMRFDAIVQNWAPGRFRSRAATKIDAVNALAALADRATVAHVLLGLADPNAWRCCMRRQRATIARVVGAAKDGDGKTIDRSTGKLGDRRVRDDLDKITAQQPAARRDEGGLGQFSASAAAPRREGRPGASRRPRIAPADRRRGR